MTRKNLGGRPVTSGDPDADRVHLSLYVPRGLKQRLGKAASERGWSINVEAAHRLENSFEKQSLLREVWVLAFGEHLADGYIKLATKAKIRLSEEVIEKLVLTFEKLLRDETKRAAK